MKNICFNSAPSPWSTNVHPLPSSFDVLYWWPVVKMFEYCSFNLGVIFMAEIRDMKFLRCRFFKNFVFDQTFYFFTSFLIELLCFWSPSSYILRKCTLLNKIYRLTFPSKNAISQWNYFWDYARKIHTPHKFKCVLVYRHAKPNLYSHTSSMRVQIGHSMSVHYSLLLHNPY